MKINENVCYASPEVEVVKVAVECGFQASSSTNPGNPGDIFGGDDEE